MAVADNSYSRFVQIAKIILPLLALALLSTLFLFSRSIDPEDAIPFVEGDIESIAENQRIATPRFNGVTTDGDKVTVTAAFATPDPSNSSRLTIEAAQARIEGLDGGAVNVTANRAIYEGEEESLVLHGQVEIETSTGYTLLSDELRTSLAQTELLSPGPVTGTGAGGVLTAGRMELLTRDGTQLLVFNQGVKLVYQPGN
ncbi:MAG: LPS export ABC transporter periplasmic protein LptC [Litoreibacter sp.]|nr:LPS export ABC transporter periplasmic protein LptC [Litoreibacter sp.]MCY4335484.1 LPS export ABC transporter periplasmic protein LptC [Litoreibacter sp.]